MKLAVASADFEAIRAHLFRDAKEAAALALCLPDDRGGYRLQRLLIPAESDYVARARHEVHLKAEFAWPILRELPAHRAPAFLQIHCHSDDSLPTFSHTDNHHNRDDVADLRERHRRAHFFRMVFWPGGFKAQRWRPILRVFWPLRVDVN